jgi:hypothetical protein
MEYNTLWNGIHYSLNELNANTMSTLRELPGQDSKTFLISIPYMEYNNDDLLTLKTFVDNGGTLMLMDDYMYGNSVLEYFNIECRFSGDPLLDPLFCYKNQWFPKIIDFNFNIVPKDVKQLTLNHATALTNIENVNVIAWSSASSFLDLNDNESWDEGEPKGPLPVAAEMKYGAGTVILVSDPSILINGMASEGDNLEFIKKLANSTANGAHIVVDTSHLAESPMDMIKTALFAIKDFLSQPWAILGIVALILTFVPIFMLKNGGSVGRKS